MNDPASPEMLRLLGDMLVHLLEEGYKVRYHRDTMPDVLGVELHGRHLSVVAKPDGTFTLVEVVHHQREESGLPPSDVERAVREWLASPEEKEREAVIAHLLRRALPVSTSEREDARSGLLLEEARAIGRLEHHKGSGGGR